MSWAYTCSYPHNLESAFLLLIDLILLKWELFFSHHMVLSLYHKNHIELKWKRKQWNWGNVASICFFTPPLPSVVIDIGGLVLRSQTSLLQMSFLSAEKTAEAVEMELVVCRCMREWDYLSVMSALLNTITPHRSERSEKDILPAQLCVELCVIWNYMRAF